MDPKKMAIDDLVKMLDDMDVENLRPKKPEVELEAKPEVEVAEVDPTKAKLLEDSFNKAGGVPDKQIKVEKKKLKVAVEPEEMDDEQKRLLEEFYSKIG